MTLLLLFLLKTMMQSWWAWEAYLLWLQMFEWQPFFIYFFYECILYHWHMWQKVHFGHHTQYKTALLVFSVQSDELLTSSSSRTASVFPQRAASCNAVPDFVCRFISIPAWISNLNTYTQENFIKTYLNTLKDLFHNTILNSTKFINLYIKRLVLILISTSFQKKKCY